MEKKSQQNAEAAVLSRTASGILKGVAVNTQFLPENSGELGFTSGNMPVVIHVAWYEHEYFKGLSEDEQTMFRMGIGAHETLHQIFTNFSYTKHVCESMTNAEAAIFMVFANTIEDPAIEYFASKVMGGWLLESLRFSIRHIYIKSPEISVSPDAFSQLISALIQFGDMGLIKGKFTFPESEKYFQIVAPLYNKAITCPDSKKRIDIAKECMELTRPIWEEAVKEKEFWEKLIKELQDALKKSGLHLGEKMESEMSSDDGDSDSKISKRRNQAVKSMDISSTGSMKNDESGESNDSDSDESGSPSISDESASSGSDDSASNDESVDNGNDTSEAGDESRDESTGSDGGKEALNEDTGNIDGLCVSPKEATKLAMDTYEVSEQALETIKSSINNASKTAPEKNTDTKSMPLPDFDISSIAFKRATCSNTRPRIYSMTSAMEIYNDIVSRHQYEIKNLEKKLSAIFKADREEESRTTSGSYNILRGSIGTTARMFDKRKDKGNTKDVEVLLCVDLSGSMSGEKVKYARETSIIFAEALTATNIPYYIMGFEADRGADANHIHFVDWSNKRNDRYGLAIMEAGGNNFDGYSIRYATELLKARPAQNKILFIISDGQPASRAYHSLEMGISDTTNAIKESRKYVRTFGIAFGKNCNPELLQLMYGADFIHCKDISLLTNILTKKLEKMIKKGRD